MKECPKNKMVGIRLSDESLELLKQWSDSEGRTMSNFIVMLLLKEKDRRSGQQVTLELLREDVLRIAALIESRGCSSIRCG